jgi:hypothetical protein
VADVLEQDVGTVLSIGAGYQLYTSEPLARAEETRTTTDDGGDDVFDENQPRLRAARDHAAEERAVGSAAKPKRARPR